jgi:hypothetical protein
LESLLVGANLHLWIHTIALAAISDRRKSSNRSVAGLRFLQ